MKSLFAIALLIVAFPIDAEAQLLSRLFGGGQQERVVLYRSSMNPCPAPMPYAHGGYRIPQPSNALHDMLRLQYYWGHLQAQEEIARNTGGIKDELVRLNDNIDEDMRALEGAIIDQAQLRILQAFIESKANMPAPPVQIQPMPTAPAVPVQPTIVLPQPTGVPLQSPTVYRPIVYYRRL